MVELILLVIGMLLCWRAIKEVIGCLVRLMMFGAGIALVLIALSHIGVTHA